MKKIILGILISVLAQPVVFADTFRDQADAMLPQHINHKHAKHHHHCKHRPHARKVGKHVNLHKRSIVTIEDNKKKNHPTRPIKS